MKRRVVTVFGGSGFIGRHLVRHLAPTGALIRVVARDAEAACYLAPMGEIGQIVTVHGDITDPDSVKSAIEGADGVVNLVGILAPWLGQTFERFHTEGAANVAQAAAEAGVAALVHVSAIGADADSSSVYARTKAAGEEAVRAAFPQATILRPSVVFGPEDGFFNRFAMLARISPALPVFGCPTLPKVTFGGEAGPVEIDLYGDGGTRFQPVFVGDVAEAIVRSLERAEAQGNTYELGGPKVYSFKEIMDLTLANIGRERFLMPLPFALAKIQAWFLEKMPNPLLTRDQVTLLETDNVVSEGALTLADLDIDATMAEIIVPTYLRRYRVPSRQKRMTA